MQFYAPIPTYARKEIVEKFAEDIAVNLELELGQPLEPLVNNLGGVISYGGMDEKEVDGGSIVAREINDFDIFLSRLTAPIRDRFTIAHELGHLFLHLRKVKEVYPDDGMRATRWVDPDDEVQRRAEWEANWFAAAFLMPGAEFRQHSEFGADYLAARFNVSRQAASVRLQSLGIND